jgi:hypothetical protein
VTPPVFRGGTVAVLACVGAVSLLVGLLWGVFGPDLGTPPTSGTDAYSRSAIGHRAFVETLRAAGIPVETSRARTAEKGERASLVIVAEPDLERRANSYDDYRSVLASGAPVLLVLSKWRGEESEPGRVAKVAWRSGEAVEAPLHEVDPSLSIARPEPASLFWARGVLPETPELLHPQLLAPTALASVERLVESSEGHVLAAVIHRAAGQPVTVVADPDLLSNHGLGRGDNALLAVALVARARDGEGPVVVDETLHGHAYDPSVFRELFRWPLALGTAAAAIAAGLWLWSGMGRFGAPAPPEPVGAAGTTELVARTADLLHRGGHGPHVLGRYLASAVAEVARATQAPADASGKALDAWLAHLEAARAPTRTLASLRTRVADAREAGPRDARRLVDTAMAVHAWRREMTHGAVGRP